MACSKWCSSARSARAAVVHGSVQRSALPAPGWQCAVRARAYLVPQAHLASKSLQSQTTYLALHAVTSTGAVLLSRCRTARLLHVWMAAGHELSVCLHAQARRSRRSSLAARAGTSMAADTTRPRSRRAGPLILLLLGLGLMRATLVPGGGGEGAPGPLPCFLCWEALLHGVFLWRDPRCTTEQPGMQALLHSSRRVLGPASLPARMGGCTGVEGSWSPPCKSSHMI